MSKTKFTASQQAAIDHAGHNILVSASAGSGKTTVLVERVIQKLLRGGDIDHLLIVTFTQAAAAEMRDRIRAALTKAVTNDEYAAQRKHLRHQLAVLGSADIATLDAFCARVVRRFYYVIDFDPAVRTLGDDNERRLLWQQVWERVRDRYYDADDADFLTLAGNFTSGRSDDQLTTLVDNLYTKAMASPDPTGWIKRLGRLYDFPLTVAGFNQSLLVAEDQPGNLRDRVIQLYSDLLAAYQRQLDTIADVADLGKLQAFGAAQFSVLKAQLSVLQHGDWDTMRAALQAASNEMGRRFPLISNKAAEESSLALKEQVKAARDDLKKAITELQTGPFLLSAANWLPIMGQAQTMAHKLTEVLLSFDQELTKTKKRRGIAEFADIELAALRILQTTTQTDIQPKLFYAEKYTEIMVDEYQDTNPLQEAILTTIAAPDSGNMFMVGDIKQSIYGFRQADPSLFAHKYTAYGDDTNASERIVLAENFRSTEAVDNMVNYLFQQLMDPAVGDVAYDDNAQLQYGAKYYPAAAAQTTQVLLVPDQPVADDDPDAAPLTGITAQAAVVGDKIKALIAAGTPVFDKTTQGTRPLRYADIALIVPTRKDNLDLLDTLTDHGVPVVMSDAREYFQTTEITVMLNYLSLIDNPQQDIPLVGLLRSPIVGLTSNELALIRIHHPQGPYYAAWHAYVTDQTLTTPLHNKLTALAAQLDRYRTLSKQVRIADLIWQIYADTGFLDYAGGMPSGKQRQANLHALYERANDYENNGFKGIFNFIRFIHQVQENDQDLAISPVTSSDDNAVTVMTIHGSKGLEYPVVFLLNAQHNFNRLDETAPAIPLNQGGVGLKVNDFTAHIAYTTPQHYYAKQMIHGVAQSEELRKLYVALTRARQELYVVGTVKKDTDTLIKKWSAAVQPETTLLSTTKRTGAASFLDLVMPALLRLPAVNDALDAGGVVSPAAQLGTPAISVAIAEPQAAETVLPTAQHDLIVRPEDYPELQQQAARWQQSYRFAQATRTAAFQTVTEIKRAQDDPVLTDIRLTTTEASGYTQSPAFRYVKDDEFTPPAFLPDQEAPLATAVGTATHLVFQELDLSQGQVTVAAVSQLIADLTTAKQIDPQAAKQISAAGVAAFYATELGALLLAHPQAVHREMPFALLLPPSEVFQAAGPAQAFPADTNILIHGIIDGYIALPDQVILFDYKTDHVQGRQDPVGYLQDQYRLQLQYYGAALGSILHQPVTAQYLYSVALQQLIPVPVRKEE